MIIFVAISSAFVGLVCSLNQCKDENLMAKTESSSHNLSFYDVY